MLRLRFTTTIEYLKSRPEADFQEGLKLIINFEHFGHGLVIRDFYIAQKWLAQLRPFNALKQIMDIPWSFLMQKSVTGGDWDEQYFKGWTTAVVQKGLKQGGNIMGLMSVININDDRKERKAVKAMDKASMKKDFGYSVYESLEYVKSNLGENSLSLQLEMIRSTVR